MDQLHGRFEHLKEEAEIIITVIVFPLLLLYIHIVVVSLNIVPEQQVVLSLSLLVIRSLIFRYYVGVFSTPMVFSASLPASAMVSPVKR
jgi:hypothetical protein